MEVVLGLQPMAFSLSIPIGNTSTEQDKKYICCVLVESQCSSVFSGSK